MLEKVKSGSTSVQEVLRVARLTDPVRVQRELDLYNRLLPGPNRLHAALLVDVNEERLAGNVSDTTIDRLRQHGSGIHFSSHL